MMTEDQFEALKRWMQGVAAVEAMRLDGGGGMMLSSLQATSQHNETLAREAFLGKTHEQPR